MIDLVWLIPSIMLLAALVNGLGVRRLGALAGHIAWLAMAGACVISFAILNEVMAHAAADSHWAGQTVNLWTWFDIHNTFGPNRNFLLQFAFHVDQLTAVFLCFVSFVGTLVFIYATGYMKEKHHGHLELDPGYARFFCYVSLFAASMFILVLGANIPMMFIGWEGVGLCSYLLIGYYFDRNFSENLTCADAGRKAFVMNRIGDAGLIAGMGLLFWGLGTLDFQQINAILISGTMGDGVTPIPESFGYGGAVITAATLLMFLGATGKSAQIPLFTWLPDAMAGPTPVSALIHAATMVTAGVYMVARLNVAYFLAPDTLAVIAIIGAATAFAAATMAMTQRGIKKVLAYSTVSQLGYMFLGLGVGAIAGGIFHVFTHAFFKAALFLGAGSVIHKMGGLRKYMPMTCLAFFFGVIAIAGVPLTSGFFSKDEILFSAYIAAGDELPILWIIGVATALLTSIYMGRLFFLTFWGEERIDPHAKEHLHEAPANMWMPVMLLSILGLIVGFLNVPPGLGGGAHFHHFLAPVVDKGAQLVAERQYGMVYDHAAHEEAAGPLVVADAIDQRFLYTKEDKAVEYNLAVVSGILALFGLAISYVFFGAGLTALARKTRNAARPLFSVSYNRWWWDDFYNTVFRDGTMKFAKGVWVADVRLIDGIVNGAGTLATTAGGWLRRVQSGQVQMYGLVMVIGLVSFLLYFAIGLQGFLENVEEQGRKDVPAQVTAQSGARAIDPLASNAETE
jgi:NADH-quinone oxidoreductase subunit L